MKKNYKKIKINLSDKLFRRRLISKAKLKSKRKSQQNLDTAARYVNSLSDNNTYTKILAPQDLSMIYDPEHTIQFINKLKELYHKKKKVFVILKNVRFIGYDALIVLLSILIKFKVNKIDFNGDFPDNITVKKILLDSGFFDYFKTNFQEQDRYELSKRRSLTTHAWKLVDSELTSELIEEATVTIWGDKRRCQGVQRGYANKTCSIS